MPGNAKPAPHVSPGLAMLRGLQRGLDNSRLIAWPGAPADSGAAVLLVPLSIDELQSAYAAAQVRFDALRISVTSWNADDFHSEINLQVLALAMRTPADRAIRLFPSADELRSAITPAERDEITTEYLELVEQADPDPDKLDPATIAELEEYIKKKDVRQLARFRSSTLSAYLAGMADRLQS